MIPKRDEFEDEIQQAGNNRHQQDLAGYPLVHPDSQENEGRLQNQANRKVYKRDPVKQQSARHCAEQEDIKERLYDQLCRAIGRGFNVSRKKMFIDCKGQREETGYPLHLFDSYSARQAKRK